MRSRRGIHGIDGLLYLFVSLNSGSVIVVISSTSKMKRQPQWEEGAVQHQQQLYLRLGLCS